MKRIRGLAAVLALALSGCAAGAASTPSPSTSEFPMFTDEAWGELPESPLSARRDSVGAWVHDRFVIVGGWSDRPCPALADCDVTEPAQRTGASYNPYTDMWQRIAPAPVPVSQYSSVVLGGDLYLFAFDIANGGLEVGPDGQVPVSFLRYTLDTDTWTTLPSPPSGGALIAAGDRVLSISGSDEIAGGVDSVYDPGSSTWTALPDDPLGRSYDREAVWLDNQLILGANSLGSFDAGSEGPAVVRLAILDSSLTEWTVLPDSDITGIGALAVAGRVVFPFYGVTADRIALGAGQPYAEGGIFNPVDQGWTALPDLPTGTPLDEYANGRPPQIVGDQVLVGGQFLLDPVAGVITPLPRPSWSGRGSATVITGPDSILVWGGVTYDGTVGENHADGYLLGL
ncbi:hypothetical protein [Cryobacterium arcticum]|uniref:Galactose oxidase n=1 Tax=Cryobacterium arcticum TaxID=670052 RepID=A0A1B1BNX5_9MICO|nr:hypothetical protein [Cryobacterium arcticum]ANP74350.1 hypothetical protein PA27867_3423 [Cryobacterium arcticum]